MVHASGGTLLQGVVMLSRVLWWSMSAVARLLHLGGRDCTPCVWQSWHHVQASPLAVLAAL